ncbi:MAG TPA: PadR family transcriptional regulator [Bryobacteraceae bacterium]|jgi:transcriptional regulator|nr:PadR family transcriptional regulator [Bryobacteraceae bacterium]
MGRGNLDKLQGTLDLLILKTLERGPLHGYGITLHIQSVSEHALQVEEGSLYPALHRLERDNLLAAEWSLTDAGRKARYYRLTSTGREALAAEEANWARLTRAVNKVLRFA